MLESPPVSPKTVRHGKRSRQSSREKVTLGELSLDDIGYDGDVEVVRPDEVEEPESETEDEVGLRGLLRWPDTDHDEELARKMKRLGWKSRDSDQRSTKSLERPGEKRLSHEVDPSNLNQHGKRTEFEVSELVDGGRQQPHAKRRKGSRSNMAKRIIKERLQVQNDTSEQTDGKNVPLDESSVSTAPEAGGDEKMDLD
jgi:hypothetical protein